MPASIHFDDELPIPAHEVRIIRPNRLLAGELEAAELPIAKLGPKLRFCLCESAPQRSRSTDSTLVLATHAPHPSPLPASGAREFLLRHLVLGQVLEDAHQAGMVPGLAAEGGRAVEQLLCSCRVGQ
jgi:hypothetical protein